MNFGGRLLEHCWTLSWVISSLDFQLELFVSLLCSEGLKWVLSLEISAGLLEVGENGFTTIGSPRGRIVVYAMHTSVWILHKHLYLLVGELLSRCLWAEIILHH